MQFWRAIKILISLYNLLISTRDIQEDIP
uniref:Uncharacterized protein n=1 Tax=Arundo donax TaxID=35708 RepID=A0A0A9EGK6_ARUDO